MDKEWKNEYPDSTADIIKIIYFFVAYVILILGSYQASLNSTLLSCNMYSFSILFAYYDQKIKNDLKEKLWNDYIIKHYQYVLIMVGLLLAFLLIFNLDNGIINWLKEQLAFSVIVKTILLISVTVMFIFNCKRWYYSFRLSKYARDASIQGEHWIDVVEKNQQKEKWEMQAARREIYREFAEKKARSKRRKD